MAALEIILSIALLVFIILERFQRKRAESAESLLDQQNELLEYQDILLKKKINSI